MHVQFRLKLCSFLEAPPAQVTEEMNVDEESTYEHQSSMEDEALQELEKEMDMQVVAEAGMEMVSCTPMEEKVKTKVQYTLAKFFGVESRSRTAMDVDEERFMNMQQVVSMKKSRGRPTSSSCQMKALVEAKQRGEAIVVARLIDFNKAVESKSMMTQELHM